MLRRRPGGLPYPKVNLGAQTPLSGPQGYQARVPLIMNTPRVAQLGSVDIIPNLLLTTLSVVAAVIPQGLQLYQSAPQAKYQTQVDVPENLLVLGYNPQPNVLRLDQTSPYPKYQVQVDQPLQAPLTLGINPQAQIQRLDASAPYPKFAVTIDQPTFHPLTLGINPQPAIQQLNQWAPYPKYQVQVDQPLEVPLTLGINPQPQVRQWSDSAPQFKGAVQVDAQVNRLNLAVVASPFLPLDTSQLQTKYAVWAEVFENVLVRGYNPQPLVGQLYQSSPQAKFSPQVDFYQNLLSTTLLVSQQPLRTLDTSRWQGKYQVELDVPQNLLETTLKPVTPLLLPLGLPVDVRQYMLKYQVEVDTVPNILVLGYPNPPVITTLPAVINIGLGFGPFGSWS